MSFILDKAFLTEPDYVLQKQAQQRLNSLTKPQGSLGRLEDIAVWMCGWQGTLSPKTDKAYTLIFAGNHGVVARGVSAYPAEVTVQMVANFENGGAAINQLCREIPSNLRIIPLSLNTPTADFTEDPAMSEREFAEAFNLGMESVPSDADILVLGEMGIGNTTVAAALAQAVCGGEAADWVGVGTGIDEVGLARKREVVTSAVAIHQRYLVDAVSVMRYLGGREQAAIAGAVWQARKLKIPVILDGYVVCAAVAAFMLVSKDSLSHCVSGHLSAEGGHKKLLDFMGMQPLLNLGMRLGEGSGAQLSLAVVRAALATFTGMATFEEAMVTGKNS
ncbi:MAG: nicotinate-nucleotide--dimethylbenzimidazole phosphoribosyltransferase [Rickettsiales bacterium]